MRVRFEHVTKRFGAHVAVYEIDLDVEPDEFLVSNLDAQLRVQTRAELKRLQQELGTTTIYVTQSRGPALPMM